MNISTELNIGDDPRALADYGALRDELAKLAHPARPDVDWQRVERLSLTLFRQNGMDLQTVAWYTLARTRLASVSGLNQGLAMLDALVTHHWGTVWPQPVHARISILSGFSQRLQSTLRTLTLCYADLPQVYQAGQHLDAILATLQRLELKNASLIEGLSQFMHAASTRLEKLEEDAGECALSILPASAAVAVPESAYAPASRTREAESPLPGSLLSKSEYVGESARPASASKVDDPAVAEPVAVPELAAIAEPVPVPALAAIAEPVALPELAVIAEPVAAPELAAIAAPVAVPELAVITESVTVPERVATDESVTVLAPAAVSEPAGVIQPAAVARFWPPFIAGALAALALAFAGLLGWQKMHPPETPLPATPDTAALTALQQQSPVWLQHYGFELAAKAAPQDAARLKAQWQQHISINALPLEALSGWHQGMEGLQEMTRRLNALDERRGKYLTGSELKSMVFEIVQRFSHAVPVEEQLYRLSQAGKNDPLPAAQFVQTDIYLNQLLNRYALIKQQAEQREAK